MSVKGILKKPSESSKADRIQWDEANLMLNESEKVPRMKVDEPKTPYVVYDSDDDMVHGMRASDGSTLPPSELQKALDQAVMEIEVDPFHEEEAPEEEFPDEDEDLTEEEREKKKQFKKLRSTHYDMANALKKGKHLIEEDEDEDEGDGK